MTLHENTTPSEVVVDHENLVEQERDSDFDSTTNSMSCGITAYDQEWGVGVSGETEDPSPFERINRLRRIYLNTEWNVDHERACLVTEGYQKYQGSTQQLKMAQVMAHVLRNLTLRIKPDELIVGEIGAPDKHAAVFPEFSYTWVLNDLKNHASEEYDGFQCYDYDANTRDKLLGLEEFWHNNTLEDRILSLMSEEELKGTHLQKGVYALNLYMHGGIGHLSPNFTLLLKLGWKGIKNQVEDQLSQLDLSLPDDIKKREFYQSLLIVLDAVTDYHLRWVELAKTDAESESGERRKELLWIADNCARTAENPPETFAEALQLIIMGYFLVQIESNGHSVSFGRLDQYLFPFYKRDIENGILTKEFAQELLESMYMKVSMCKKHRVHTVANNPHGEGLGGTTITVGGVDRDGHDATNDLSFMCVDAAIHTRLIEPWLLVRWHENTPREFQIKCVSAIKVGTGRPKLFNDRTAIPSAVAYGRSQEDARDYSVVGCVEIDSAGREYGWHDAAYFNKAKILELALNNGRCMECDAIGNGLCPRYDKCRAAGKRLGLETGSLADFNTFDELKKAFDKQMKYFVDLMISGINILDIAHQRYKPLPLLSLLIEGCIDKGTDATAGGAVYNFSGPQAIATGTTGDGLSAIKQLVFEEQRISGEDYLTALKQNWEGYEWLQALVNSDKIPHYGNDNDFADELTKFGFDTYCKHVERRPTAHGGVFVPGVYSVATNVAFGKTLWATPDGREAGEPVSDCLGAVHNNKGTHDISGPTAMLKSVTKLDHVRSGNGTLLNMKFSPSSVSGKTGTDNLISLIDTYFENGGMHCQFNVLSRETLIDAYENPEKHKHLIVRVAGYSAFFNEMNDSLKLDIINRTELSFD